MEYRQLLGNKLKVSVLGFGGWAIGGHGYGVVSDSESIAAIQAALDRGINLFDTADTYGFGYSEKILSRGLGKDRNNVVIATKGGVKWDSNGKTCIDSSPQHLRYAVEQSLRRLQIDRIPLYQLHWHDGVTPIDEVFGALLGLQKEGLINCVGVSNVNYEFVSSAQKIMSVVTNQLQYSYINRENGKLIKEQFKKLNVKTICYGVLARGLLTGKYGINSSFGVGDTRSNDKMFGPDYNKYSQSIEKLKKMAKRVHCKPLHIALKWAISNEFVASVLVGMKSKSQVVGNCKVLELLA